jgi:type IV pilus assembly protein PilA
LLAPAGESRDGCGVFRRNGARARVFFSTVNQEKARPLERVFARATNGAARMEGTHDFSYLVRNPSFEHDAACPFAGRLAARAFPPEYRKFFRVKIRSKKAFTLAEILIVVVIIGLLAAMAIPALQKVRKNSQDKAIANNLRELNAAAQQYFLENGAMHVSVEQLVGRGAGKYIKSVQLVRDESYPAMINAADTQIIATSAAGDVIYTP